MLIECRHIAELPFNLNLPDGLFEVRVGAINVPLHVFQDRVAAHLGANDESGFLLVSKAQLAAGIPGEHPVFTQRLRTVVELSEELPIPREEMHVPTQEELKTEMSRMLILKR